MKKMTPELNKKRCLKTYPKKTKNASKVTPKSLPENEWIWGLPPLGALWSPKQLLGIESKPPALPKCFQQSKNKPNIIPRSPSIVKKSSKSQAFSEPSLADCAKRLQYYYHSQGRN